MPAALDPSGSVIVTASPTLTSPCSEASKAIDTTCWVEVAVTTGPDAGPPRLPGTVVTRSAAGSNTNDPCDREPDGLEIPSDACSFCTPAAVAEEN